MKKPKGYKGNLGEKNGRAKLRENDVIDIRMAYQRRRTTMRELAEIFDVAPSLVHGIVHRIFWRHV